MKISVLFHSHFPSSDHLAGLPNQFLQALNLLRRGVFCRKSAGFTFNQSPRAQLIDDVFAAGAAEELEQPLP